jgi:hypothetical protein
LAKKLLCKDEPLPPASLQSRFTFYAVMESLVKCVELECDKTRFEMRNGDESIFADTSDLNMNTDSSSLNSTNLSTFQINPIIRSDLSSLRPVDERKDEIARSEDFIAERLLKLQLVSPLATSNLINLIRIYGTWITMNCLENARP